MCIYIYLENCEAAPRKRRKESSKATARSRPKETSQGFDFQPYSELFPIKICPKPRKSHRLQPLNHFKPNYFSHKDPIFWELGQFKNAFLLVSHILLLFPNQSSISTTMAAASQPIGHTEINWDKYDSFSLFLQYPSPHFY